MQSPTQPKTQSTIDLSFQTYTKPAQADLTEAELRVQLAAAYRLVARFGMSDLIYTHISVRLPGDEPTFLINPFGLMFHEITASSLVKIDVDGNILEDNGYPVNPAGFVIHSAIHMARHEVGCVMHTHSRYGMAVSMLECGLLPVSQFSLQFHNRVAYHHYEGLALDLGERDRLIADLGDKPVMILHNHGLLTAGATVPEAFYLLYYLEKSCEVQITAQSAGVPLIYPSEAVCDRTVQQYGWNNVGELEWAALTRLLDREDPSYRD
ncbi:MAG TPA: class II aldolase/adducin family protein [Chroococcidiopsis sp.]